MEEAKTKQLREAFEEMNALLERILRLQFGIEDRRVARCNKNYRGWIFQGCGLSECETYVGVVS